MAHRQRHGFSLIEALVVLAISGLALAIIFGIGTKAGDTGFSLGRRAMTVADSDIAASDLRSIIRSIVLRPTDTFTEKDQPVVGNALKLEADVVMERATLCAPQGWAGRMTLSIDAAGGQKLLTCRAGGQSAVLMTIAAPTAVFFYSVDRQDWSQSYSNAPSGRSPSGIYVSQALWVRFSGRPSADITEAISSGRVENWTRPDNVF